MTKRLLLAFAVTLIAIYCSSQNADEFTARDIFWSSGDLVAVSPNPAGQKDVPAASAATRTPQLSAADSKTQIARRSGYGKPARIVRTNEQALGLRYTLLKLGADRRYGEVLPTATFHSGDALQLSLLPNESCVLYVAARENDGRWKPFHIAMDSNEYGKPLKAGQLYVYPPKSTEALKFDNPPGREDLFVVLSRKPLSIDSVIEQLKGIAAGVPDDTLGGGVALAENFMQDPFTKALRARGLELSVVDDVDSPSGPAEAAVYVVRRVTGNSSDGVLIAHIPLNHQ